MAVFIIGISEGKGRKEKAGVVWSCTQVKRTIFVELSV